MGAVGSVDGDALDTVGRQDDGDGVGLVAVGGADRDTYRGDRDGCPAAAWKSPSNACITTSWHVGLIFRISSHPR